MCSADTPQESTDNSSEQCSEQSWGQEKKVKDFNDCFLFTKFILAITDPTDIHNNDIEGQDAWNSILDLNTSDFDKLSKRVQNGRKLKRLFQGYHWNYQDGGNTENLFAMEDWRWLFYGNNYDTHGVIITALQYWQSYNSNGVEIYGYYKQGLHEALLNWNGDEMTRPAYFELPEANIYISQFEPMEQIASIFYTIFLKIL